MMSLGEAEQEEPRRRCGGKVLTMATLLYVNFWNAATVSLQAPFFPQEAEAKGATATQYGFVFGIFELVVIFASPIYGKIIPAVKPKFLLISGVLLGGIACCVFGLLDKLPAGQMYIVSCFLVRIVEGAGAAAVLTCSFTIVAAEFPDSVATMFSIVETGFGLGLIVGPTIGGALYQVGGFLVPFVVAGAFLLIGAPFVIFCMSPLSMSGADGGKRDVWGFLLDVGIVTYTCSIITSLLFIGFNAATLEPHLRKFELSPIVLGLVFVITGGIYAVTTSLWGWICDRGVNPLHINLGGYIMTSVGLLFIGPVPFMPFEESLDIVIGSLVVIGFGLSAKLVSSFSGALQNTVKRGFPSGLGTYSMVSALFSTACSTGAFIGPSMGGLLLDTTGYRTGTVIVFGIEVFFMACLIAAVVLEQWRKKHTTKDHEDQQALYSTNMQKSYSSIPNSD